MLRYAQFLNASLLIVVCAFAASGRAQSESAKVRSSKSTTTITTITEDRDDASAEDAATKDAEKDYLVTKTFGPKGQTGLSGCKTEELSEKVVADLEATCDAWLKTQEKKLKKKYNTGSCEESCQDCGTSLKRCSVVGAVHYSK